MDPNAYWWYNSGLNGAYYPAAGYYPDVAYNDANAWHMSASPQQYYQIPSVSVPAPYCYQQAPSASGLVYQQPSSAYGLPYPQWQTQTGVPQQVAVPLLYNFTAENWAAYYGAECSFHAPKPASSVVIGTNDPLSPQLLPKEKESGSSRTSKKDAYSQPSNNIETSEKDSHSSLTEVEGKLGTLIKFPWNADKFVISDIGGSSSDEDTVCDVSNVSQTNLEAFKENSQNKSGTIDTSSVSIVSPTDLNAVKEKSADYRRVSEEESISNVVSPTNLESLKDSSKDECVINSNPPDSVDIEVSAPTRTHDDVICCTLASKLSKQRLNNDDDCDLYYVPRAMKKESLEMKFTSSDSGNSSDAEEPSDITTMKLPKADMSEIPRLPVPEPARASFELQREMYQQLADLYDDFERECEAADLDAEKVDLASYVQESWPYIAKAAVDPSMLSGSDLAEVGRVIVTRALEDPGYFKVAVTLIDFIFKKEVKGIDMHNSKPQDGKFREGIVESCIDAVDDWNKWVKKGLHFCLTLVEFLSSSFQTLKLFGNSLCSLGSTLLDLLLIIASPPAIYNFELVQLLCCVLHDNGKIMDVANEQKMEQLMGLIRDALVDPDMDPSIRSMLLGPIELRASSWTLSESAQQYYFS